MALSEDDHIATSFELARFAASAAAITVAALHRGKPIEDKHVKRLLQTLADCAAQSPDAARPIFDALAETVGGKHYEGG